jgi:uncharacterized membrane protein
VKKKEETTGHWLLRTFRKDFLAGMLLIIPLVIAIWILWWLFSGVDNLLQPAIEYVFGRQIPGVGFGIFLVLIYITGVIASNYLGNKIVHFSEALLTRVPIFRQLYIGAKQVVEGLSGAGVNKAAFREVVFVDFPRPGMTTIAFITSVLIDKSGQKYYALYIPTAPIPTSGYFEIATEEQIIHTDIPIDEGIKIVISSGMILPDKVSTGKEPVTAPQDLADAFTELIEKQKGSAKNKYK